MTTTIAKTEVTTELNQATLSILNAATALLHRLVGRHAQGLDSATLDIRKETDDGLWVEVKSEVELDTLTFPVSIVMQLEFAKTNGKLHIMRGNLETILANKRMITLSGTKGFPYYTDADMESHDALLDDWNIKRTAEEIEKWEM